MKFSDFIGMDAGERAAQASEVIGETVGDRDALLSIIEEIYEGGTASGLSDGQVLLLLGASLYKEDPHIRERALLTLFHRLNESSMDEGEFEDARSFLREYSADAREEHDERLRGRKHWVLLNLLRAESDVPVKVEEYVRGMREEENSSYVWERICAFLQGWSESYRLYPEMESWNIPLSREGDPYWALVRKTERKHLKSLEADRTIRDGLAEWTAAATCGEFPVERLSWIFENYGKSGSDFPLPENLFFGLYMDAGPRGRVVLLSYLGKYLADGDWKRSLPFRSIVTETPPSSDAVYERSAVLLLEGFSFLKGERPSPPFSESVELLVSPFPHHYERPEVYHSLSGAFSPLLLRYLVDNAVEQENIRQLADMLCHSSPYVRVAGATLLLQARRSGYDITALVPLLKEVLSDDPDSSNALAGGKDIEEEEFSLSFDFPPPKSFLLAEGEGGKSAQEDESEGEQAGKGRPEAQEVNREKAGEDEESVGEEEGSEAEKEDGFFNLGNLTGLLEACKPPLAAFRLGMALREHAEAVGDTALAAFLSRFADRNAALEGISADSISGPYTQSGPREKRRSEPILELNGGDAGEGTGDETGKGAAGLQGQGAEAIPRTQVGPLRLPEVLKMLEEAVDGVDNPGEAKQKAAHIAAKKAESVEKHFGSSIQTLQRRLIRQVFESAEAQPHTADAPSSDSSGEAMQEEAEAADGAVGLFSSIYERMRSTRGHPLELCGKTHPKWTEGGEVHPDLLACYVPLHDSGLSGNHRYGIYFFINRLIDLIFARGLQDEPLLRTVAVHELFHAHMNWRLPDGGRGHRHVHEHPSYCRLEEAAANRLAYDWLHGRGYESVVTADIDAAIFRIYGDGGGGLPGYGEYPLLDGDAPQLLPEMITNSPQHVDVRLYRMRKALYQWGFSPRRRDSEEWWRWLLETMDEGTVPMYFDVNCT